MSLEHDLQNMNIEKKPRDHAFGSIILRENKTPTLGDVKAQLKVRTRRLLSLQNTAYMCADFDQAIDSANEQSGSIA